MGRAAVASAMKAESGTIVLKRAKGRAYRCTPDLVPLKRVAKFTKSMPRSFINRAGNDVTKAFLDYASPLAGPLHPVGRLRGM